MSGLAVTGLHFPQGLAYAILAGLPPGIGMVSTIFPLFIYMFFGSAAHTSIGTNAIVSIMIGDMLLEPNMRAAMATASASASPLTSLTYGVLNDSDVLQTVTETIADTTSPLIDADVYMQRRISLVAGATFYTGIIFIVMAIFKMGFLVTYLSQPFMCGFTTGVAVHIFSSQIKTALGLKLPPIEGAGKLVKLYYHVFANITSVHVADLVVSLICVVILLAVKIGINERLKLRVAIPIDFILLLVATIISYFAGLPEKFDVKSLGVVELGIPTPVMPALAPAGTLITYACQIALVTFFLNISVVKIIARRNGYEINENVELNAYGMCNIIPAFFSNIPASIAPPRASLLSSMGAKTTLNGVSTVGIMLALIFYFGQFFESCPKAVLAAMIMVAMKDLLKQVTTLPKVWKVNKNDFTTWVFAACTCVFIDIPYGLALGVLISLLSVINQSQRGWVSVIGKSDSEDLYLDAQDYGAIHEIPGIKIVRMESSLYFATAEKFRKNIYKIIEKESDKYSDEKLENNSMTGNSRTKSDEALGETTMLNNKHPDVYKETIKEDDNEQEHTEDEEEEESGTFRIKGLVIDCISINFIDGTGLDMLKMVIFELGYINIPIYLARCSRYMLHLLEKSDMYEVFPREHVFIDLPDAVYFAMKESKMKHEHHFVEIEEDHHRRPSSRPSRLMSLHSINSDIERIHRKSIFVPIV